MFRSILLPAALVAGLFASAAAARPLTPAEKRYSPYTAQLARCDDPGVLGRIRTRFAQKESEYWNSAAQIVSFDRIRQIGWRSWGLDHIPRRYCSGRVLLSDGRKRGVDYWVGEDLGMIGWGYGVEWCVHGFDRNFAYAPHCKMARP